MAVKRYRKKDPHKKREGEKYEHPVPSREHITQYLEELGQPATKKHLSDAFGIESEAESEGIRRRLRAMERDGQIMRNRRGSYALVNKLELIAGRVQGHKDGFGFLIPDNGSPDIFLPAQQMQRVFTDDRVLVRASDQMRGKREGMIVEVLERNTQHIVGRYILEDGVAFIDPDNKNIAKEIMIPRGEEAGAKPGQFVVAEIIAQPQVRRQPIGKIIEILGDHLTPGMEVELAIRAHDLPFQWPEAVIKAAEKFPKKVHEQDCKDRCDLRHLPFVTIDGEDAKDFDDAVYCEPNNDGSWKLYVAIADVAYYVKPGSELDVEAQLRGNSVYFPSKVVPMLPEALSTTLCSLLPLQDRLTMVCEMKLSAVGKVTKFCFYEGVIHSHARLTYTEVANMLAGKKSTHEFILPHIKDFYRLYQQLHKQRQHRGAIEFNTVETQILFDQKGKIASIVPRERNDAHRMIEEAMLLANVCTAKHLESSGIAALYRIHEGPEEQKLFALRDFLKAFGLRLTGGKDPSPEDYCNLLQRINKRPDAHLLQTVMLRSLRQAVYKAENLGHFGLAYEGYTHFTSPIRRYPDLIVHRALKHLIKRKKPKAFQYDEAELDQLGEHCSLTERRADRATRDATDWLKCEYMMDKVGQTFDGYIVDVTSFGVFVELKDIYAQGLLHITALSNDYYHYDATAHLLRGKRSGQTYRLGDSVRVMVARVDLDEREVDFELAE